MSTIQMHDTSDNPQVGVEEDLGTALRDLNEKIERSIETADQAISNSEIASREANELLNT
jgi:hypothetical protein